MARYYNRGNDPIAHGLESVQKAYLERNRREEAEMEREIRRRQLGLQEKDFEIRNAPIEITEGYLGALGPDLSESLRREKSEFSEANYDAGKPYEPFKKSKAEMGAIDDAYAKQIGYLNAIKARKDANKEKSLQFLSDLSGRPLKEGLNPEDTMAPADYERITAPPKAGTIDKRVRLGDIAGIRGKEIDPRYADLMVEPSTADQFFGRIPTDRPNGVPLITVDQARAYRGMPALGGEAGAQKIRASDIDNLFGKVPDQKALEGADVPMSAYYPEGAPSWAKGNIRVKDPDKLPGVKPKKQDQREIRPEFQKQIDAVRAGEMRAIDIVAPGGYMTQAESGEKYKLLQDENTKATRDQTKAIFGANFGQRKQEFETKQNQKRADEMQAFQKEFKTRTVDLDKSLNQVEMLKNFAGSYDPEIAQQIDSQFIAKMIQGGQISNQDARSSGFVDVKSLSQQWDQFWRNQSQLGRDPESQKRFIKFVGQLERAVLSAKTRMANEDAKKWMAYSKTAFPDEKNPRTEIEALKELAIGPFFPSFDEGEALKRSEGERIKKKIPLKSPGMIDTAQAGLANTLKGWGVPEAFVPANPIEEQFKREQQAAAAPTVDPRISAIKSLGKEAARKNMLEAIRKEPARRAEFNKMYREAFGVDVGK